MAAIEASLHGRAYNTVSVAAEFLRDRSTPYLDRERLAELRDARLRGLVAYAAETVPHYGELFATEGIDTREIRTAADLDRLPIVEKATLQSDPERFRSRSRRGRTAIPFRTSGSTGMPLTIYIDRRSLLGNLAWSERERAVEARLCGKRFWYRGVDIDWSKSTDLQTRAFYRATTITPWRPARVWLPIEAPMDETIAQLNEIRADVVRGYGTYLETLFRTIHARGTALHLPKVVVYASDLMTRAGQRLIERRFGIPVISSYNAVEAFKIGFTCEERCGFHLHDDLSVVRIVDERGRTVPEGEAGEVVITNLVNHGTVLLNYRLGDVGSRRSAPCACGRTLPLLMDLEGRVGDFIRRPDGRLIGSTEITEIVTSKDGILRYQLVQRDEERFELRLQTTTEEACEGVQDAIVAELCSLFGGAARIKPVRCERFESQPHEKFKRVFSLFDATKDV